MNETFVCAYCGETYPISELHMVEDQALCVSCMNEETVICSCCGEIIHSEDNAGNEDTPLCRDCYDRHYTTCSDCGRLISCSDSYYEDDNEDDPLCYDCYQRCRSHRAIHDYYYKPEPIFYGTGSRYLGVELEIDEGGESHENAGQILRLANSGDELVYCKHDGSLNEGFEIVTHPMTLDFHCSQMPWENLVQKAVAMGYTSHQARTCGLHVHVNRTSFGADEEQQDSCIARVLYFFERHWEELLKFSRRTEAQLQQWAARYGYKDQPSEILEHAKKGYGGGRYSCVNLQNRDTVEFRMFRGTLRYSTLIATLQLVDHLCNLSVAMTDEEIKALSWTSFVSGIDGDTHLQLIAYLKERRLYTNEPVAMTEEV